MDKIEGPLLACSVEKVMINNNTGLHTKNIANNHTTLVGANICA